MKSSFITLSTFALLSGLFLSPALRAADDFAMIVERYRGWLFSGRADAAAAAGWVARLEADGRWADVDYTSEAGSAWPAVDHLRRVRGLARATGDPRSALHGDAAAGAATERALGHWIAMRYQNPNWWQNQIGVPQVMRDIIVLLGDRLTGEARAGAMAVLHQFVLMEPGFGANTIWSAELALMAAALERDDAALGEAAARIAGEISVGAEQGLQDDFSFQQHGRRLQQFHYGRSFLSDTVRVTWLLRGTPWEIPSARVAILADFALQGNLWMGRGVVTVPGTLDRAVSRRDAMRGADMRDSLAWLADVLPERRRELLAALRGQNGEAPGPRGFRAFPRSDFAVYHTDTYSFFLKTISPRTELTETLLGENRKGRKLNWGDHYVLTDGSNYVELPPVWDWNLLPGVTSTVAMDSIERRAFAGAIGDGRSGAVAMDYRVGVGGSTRLKARKFWAMHDGVVVGLIADLTASEAVEPVRTALDQRPLAGPVTTGGDDAGGGLVTWVHHDGLIYLSLGDAVLSVRQGPARGSWREINDNLSDEPVEADVFMPVLEHGRGPRRAAAGFVIAASATAEAARAWAARPTWTVWRNDASVQAVGFGDDGVGGDGWMAAFYAADKLKVGGDGGVDVRVSAPCLVLVSDGKLRAADPTQAGLTLRLRIGDREIPVECPPDGRVSEPVRW